MDVIYGNATGNLEVAVGKRSSVANTSVVDCLMAATAAVNRMTLVTRNDGDVAGLGVSVLNPFRPR